MARYNSINTTSSVSGGSTISTPASGLLTTLTGSGTVTIPNPVYYTGSIQTYYNSTASAITITTPSGVINGPEDERWVKISSYINMLGFTFSKGKMREVYNKFTQPKRSFRFGK